MPKDDGGPAFPWAPGAQPQNPDGTWNQTWDPGESGMSLRDWFAGMAMQGLLANPNKDYAPNGVSAEAYDYADAMLEQRNK